METKAEVIKTRASSSCLKRDLLLGRFGVPLNTSKMALDFLIAVRLKTNWVMSSSCAKKTL